jgi:hypothetical protein
LTRLLTLLVAGGLAASLVGAPKLKKKEPPIYMPTAVGTEWVYDDNGRDWTEEIAAAKAGDGGERHLTIRYWADPAEGAHEKTVVVSASGVFHQYAAGIYHDPMCLLKLPLTPGQTWEVNLSLPEFRFGYDATMTVGVAEAVKVPAGTFQAVPVRKETTTRNGRKLARPEVTTTWWAPDMGVVRYQSGDTDRKLKQFMPGKK